MHNLSQMIRSFNRFEMKYLLTLKQAEVLKSALRVYLVDDEHGHGRYTLTSLYYDSPDYRCYWEKVDGVEIRRKLRIRHYETDEPLTERTPVFVEIKQRVDRVTQKRRAVLPYREALRLCTDRQPPENCDPQDEPTVNEILSFVWQYNLRPASLVRYERQALIGTDYDVGLRVTFDTQLAYQTHPLHLAETFNGLAMFPPNLAVMEIKVNERLPDWLINLVANHNLQLERISKYCRSLEVAGVP